MWYDLVAMKRTPEVEEVARSLGFARVFALDEVKGVVEGKDDLTNRNLVEKGQIKVLLNPHLVAQKDRMHARSGGLNQVVCQFAHDRKIAIGFSLDALQDPIQLGRLMQDIRLCRKYKVEMLFCTRAKSVWELRGAQDLLALCRVLGMTPGEAKEALTGLEIYSSHLR